MSLAQREKGRRWAVKVANWLDTHGVEHVRDHNGKSEADFALDLVTLEAKDQNPDVLRLGAALDQARRDAGPSRLGAVLHHRRGKADVEHAFVTMRADDWLEMYGMAVDPHPFYAHRAEPRVAR